MRSKILLIIVSIFISNQSFAIKDCYVEIDKFYYGDSDRKLWVEFREGVKAVIPAKDADNRPEFADKVFSIILAAKMANKKLTVRFVNSGASCTSGTHNDVLGVWVN